MGNRVNVICPAFPYSLMYMTVKCKICGHIFPSGIQVDPATFQQIGTQMTNSSKQCPRCHQLSAYDIEDYIYEE